jgi:hypothetical protein
MRLAMTTRKRFDVTLEMIQGARARWRASGRVRRACAIARGRPQWPHTPPPEVRELLVEIRPGTSRSE